MGMEEELKELKKRLDSLEESLNTLMVVFLEHEHSSPISARCKAILERGPVCEDAYKAFIEQRRYVLCYAFDALEKGEVKSFGEGIRKGWEKVREVCP